jgi:hypothetical protein
MKPLFTARTAGLFVAALLATATVGSLRNSALADPPNKAEHKLLVREGARLWPIYCNQCHNARPPSEKAPYEWNQVIMHMRTLGNIPASDARALVEYLKAR